VAESDDRRVEDGEEAEPVLSANQELKLIQEKYRVPLNTWIIKPGENTNRGVGISVSSEMAENNQLVGGGFRHENG
jgi:hypothetical protein